jgi:hypothetical protein
MNSRLRHFSITLRTPASRLWLSLTFAFICCSASLSRADTSESGNPPPTAPPAPASEDQALPSLPMSLPVLATTGIALLGLAIFMAVRAYRRRFIFPVPEYRYRLCAPFSGGNSVRLDYGVQEGQAPPK